MHHIGTALTIILGLFINQYSSAQKIEPIGSGLTMSGIINDITKSDVDDSFCVVGSFAAIDGKLISDIAINKNDIWQDLENSQAIIGTIYTASFFEGELYIGGSFEIDNNEKTVNLAKLKNGEWQNVGINQMSGVIYDIEHFEEELYITGNFRSINGTKTDALMKYSNGIWQEAELEFKYNPEGLFVKGDTLFAWGNSNNNNPGISHSLSYLTDENWTTLPIIGSQTNWPDACIVFNSTIFCNIDHALYEFSESENAWKFKYFVGNSPISHLVNHQGNLYAATFDSSDEVSTIFKLGANGFQEVILADGNPAQLSSISVLKSINNALIIGGDFHDFSSTSVSLSKLDDNTITSIGRVSSNVTHRDAWNYSSGNAIVQYNNKWLIAGLFPFANHLYSPNLAYWDGIQFTPFESPLSNGIRSLKLFEGELYATTWYNSWSDPALEPYDLIKYDGESWKGVNTPFEVDDIQIVNDELFLHYEYNSFEDTGLPYIKNGALHYLKKFEDPDTTIPPWAWVEYSNVQAHDNGYLTIVTNFFNNSTKLIFSPTLESEWEIIDSISIFNEYSLKTIQNRIFFLDREEILEYKNGAIDTALYDVGTRTPFFFEINDKINFSSTNEDWYAYQEGSGFINRSALSLRALEPLDQDSYLFLSQDAAMRAGLETQIFNQIGILRFSSPEVELYQSKVEVCQRDYVEFWPETEDVELNWDWELEGGTPKSSTSVAPMIRYDSIGSFKVSLSAANFEGQEDFKVRTVDVKKCESIDDRSNNYDNHWIMGYNYYSDRGLGGFDFTFKDTIISPRYHAPNELHNGSTIMSNKEGSLQFYTNGIDIWNMHNELMDGSECFNSDLLDYSLDYYISNQSVMCLPDVSDDNIYHILDLSPFVAENDYWLSATNLSMTSIDMSLNNGYGKVISCDEIVINDHLLTSTMQATRHANQVDWWILVGKYGSDQYYRMLLTENGIESINTDSWEVEYNFQFNGQSTFSSDGKFFAQVFQDEQKVFIWEFDNSTGKLSKPKTIQLIVQDEFEKPRGCSFSPNGRFLYVASLSVLRQIDLCNINDIDIKVVEEWDGTYEFIYPLFFGKMMMTPAQQIIVTHYGNSHRSFGIVNQPNEKTPFCDFNQHAISTSEWTRNSANVLPIFPHFRLYPNHEEDCIFVSLPEVEDISDEIIIYPNPVQKSSSLRFNKEITGELLDNLGNTIQKIKNTNYLDIYHLPSGTYFIKTSMATKKFIVTN